MSDPIAGLIPPSINDERTRALMVLGNRLPALDLDLLLNLYNPDLCPEAALPFLALQFGVLDEAWALAGTSDARRVLVKRAYQLQRLRGTPWALKEALSAVGWPGMQLQERSSHPAMFKVVQPLLGRSVPLDELSRMVAVIEAWKPARCVLEAIEFQVTFSSQVGGTGAHYDGTLIHDAAVRHEGLALDAIATVKVGEGAATVGAPVASVVREGARILVSFHLDNATANGLTLDTYEILSAGGTVLATASTAPVAKTSALTLDILWTLFIV